MIPRLASTSMRFAAPAARRMMSTPAASAARPFGQSTALKVGLAVGGSAMMLGGVTLAAPKDVDWKALKQDLENLLDDDSAYNPGADNFPGARGGGGDIAPMMVRLAWHCSGTYSCSAGNGGSDGATMRYNPEASHGGNAGLGAARDLLEPIKKKHPNVSYADLYIYVGKVALEHMGANDIGFKCGRSDADEVKAPEADKRFSPDGRLPNGGMPTAEAPTLQDSAQHCRDIFYRMGFNDQEIVALMGGHAIGRCHTDRSGYWGPWTRAPTTLSNEYYRLLMEEKWTPKKTHNGQAWRGPVQYEDPSGELMMLPTDMAMKTDDKFRKYTEMYAKDEAKFLSDFGKAWTKLTELGCSGLTSTDGKLGWRKYIFFGERQ